MALYGPKQTQSAASQYEGTSYWEKTSYTRPRAGRHSPCPYRAYRCQSSQYYSSAATGARECLATHRDSQAINAALSRFDAKLDTLNSASGGAALAEWGQTSNMVAQRAHQFATFLKAVRRRDVTLAADVLRDAYGSRDLRKYELPSKKGSVWRPRAYEKAVRSVADTTLEVNFGWRPFVGDIHAGVAVLTAPLFPPYRSKGSNVVHDDIDYPRPRGYGWSATGYLAVRATVGARVVVTDPNAYLARQLGFTNPLAVMHEVTPWSFLFDWVSNLGDIIDSLDREVGLSLTDKYYSISRQSGSMDLYWPSAAATAPTEIMTGSGAFIQRYQGLPGYTWQSQLELPSTSRIANAFSLLAQVVLR